MTHTYKKQFFFFSLVTDSGRWFWLLFCHNAVSIPNIYWSMSLVGLFCMFFLFLFFKASNCVPQIEFTLVLDYHQIHCSIQNTKTHLFKNWTKLYKNIYTLLNLCNSFDPAVTLNMFSFTKCELNVSSLMASCKVWQSYVYCPRKSAIVVCIIQPAIPMA